MAKPTGLPPLVLTSDPLSLVVPLGRPRPFSELQPRTQRIRATCTYLAPHCGHDLKPGGLIVACSTLSHSTLWLVLVVFWAAYQLMVEASNDERSRDEPFSNARAHAADQRKHNVPRLHPAARGVGTILRKHMGLSAVYFHIVGCPT